MKRTNTKLHAFKKVQRKKASFAYSEQEGMYLHLAGSALDTF